MVPIQGDRNVNDRIQTGGRQRQVVLIEVASRRVARARR
jgi:hypothetical protein